MSDLAFEAFLTFAELMLFRLLFFFRHRMIKILDAFELQKQLESKVQDFRMLASCLFCTNPMYGRVGKLPEKQTRIIEKLNKEILYLYVQGS